MKKRVALLLIACFMVLSLTACSRKEAGDKKHSVGFVTFSTNGDFFQALADTFKTKMEAAGWEADYVDGKFDPATQIEAVENYIAKGVDALVIWAVAPEPLESVIKDAMDKGIKVIAFVCPLTQYDVLMVSDDAELADNCAKVAAKWIDEQYADAPDHSVPVAVLSCRVAETGVVQGDELLKIEQFSKKAKFALEVECADESMETGISKAENMYATNPEIKVFLSAHNGLALGVNNFFTASGSPVTDYSGMGIFIINGDASVAEVIKTSAEGKSPLRGMVLTGGVDVTVQEIMDMVVGSMDGSVESGFLQKAGTVFVTPETAEEFISTGKVDSLSAKDFE